MKTCLFHITRRENLDSILKDGIIPAKNKGLTVHASTRLERPWVFLTDSPYKPVKQLYNEYNKSWIWLVVNTDEIPVEPWVIERPWLLPEQRTVPNEFIVKQQVDPCFVHSFWNNPCDLIQFSSRVWSRGR